MHLDKRYTTKPDAFLKRGRQSNVTKFVISNAKLSKLYKWLTNLRCVSPEYVPTPQFRQAVDPLSEYWPGVQLTAHPSTMDVAFATAPALPAGQSTHAV